MAHMSLKTGRIVHGQPATTNVGFGGDDWKTLFFTTRTSLGSVNIKVAGTPVPGRATNVKRNAPWARLYCGGRDCFQSNDVRASRAFLSVNVGMRPV
jgi:hypothetical protein